MPFERLVDALRPVRAQNHHPLFQTMLVLQNHGDTTVDLRGLTVTQQPVHTGISKFDLTFTFTETHDGSGRPPVSTASWSSPPNSSPMPPRTRWPPG